MAVDNSFARYGAAQGGVNDRRADDDPLRTNRFHGGKSRVVQPYTGGNFYVVLRPPEFIFPNGTAQNFENLVMSTVRTYQPHTITPGFVDDVVMGGLGSSFMNGRNDIGREFTLTFRDLQNIPVVTMIRQWASFNNPYYGTSSADGDQVIPKNYKGDCFVIITRPSVSDPAGGGQLGGGRHITVRDIEEVFYYDGVFPKSVPVDVLNQDISSSELIEPSVTWSFDGYPMDKSFPYIMDQAVTEFNARADWGDMFNRHYDQEKGPFKADNSVGYQFFNPGGLRAIV